MWRLINPRRAGSGATGQGSTALAWVDATQAVRFGSEKSPRVTRMAARMASTHALVGARKGRQVRPSGPPRLGVGLLAALVPVVVIDGILGGQLLVVDLVVRLRSRGR